MDEIPDNEHKPPARVRRHTWIVISVIGLAVFAVIVLYVSHRLYYPNDRISSVPSGELVDPATFNDCLRQTSQHRQWKLNFDDGSAGISGVLMWGQGKSQGSLSYQILPDIPTTRQYFAQFARHDTVEGTIADTHANVVFHSDDGTEFPRITREVRVAVSACMKSAARRPSKSEQTEIVHLGSFQSCGGAIENTIFDVYARGISCAKALSILKSSLDYSMSAPSNRNITMDTTLSKYAMQSADDTTCCANSGSYAGNDHEQIIYVYSV